MKSEDELKSRIEELKAQGSPSALSKARELEIALGIEEEPDEESDLLVDTLMKGLSETGAESLWKQLPEFVSNHQMYTFWKQGEALKVTKPADWNESERGKWSEVIAKAERETELTKGKAFQWKKLLGRDGAIALSKKLKKKRGKNTYEEGFYTKIPDEAASIETAELISSLTKKGTHRPLLDLDIPVVVIPSSTPGHGHLYIDKEMPWKDYQKLLNCLADLDIIEHGYRGASLARGYSALRLPWIKKEKLPEDKVELF